MRFSKLLIAFAIAAMGCGAPAAEQAAEDHAVYASYSAVQQTKDGDIESAGYSVGADGSNYIPGSDVVMSVKFCPLSSPYICVHGDFYNFAVPRHDLAAGEKWQFVGRTYEVVPGYVPHAMFQPAVRSNDIDRTFRVFNSEITVNVIRTVVVLKDTTCIHTFLYSRAHGVLGEFGRCDGPEKHDSWNYWVIGSDGIGSPIFEKAMSPKAVMTQAEAVKLFNQ